MGKRWFLWLLLIFVLINSPFLSHAAIELTNTGAEYHFGQVKSPPRPLEWRVLKDTHFEIYFYQGLEEVALRCRSILEEAYNRVYPDFSGFFTINRLPPVRVILFASRRDFQNAEATGTPLTATPEGVAHFLVGRLAVICQPTLRDLRGVLIHEVTHIITLHPFRNRFLGSGGQPPDWLVEGLAEYYTPEESRFPMREGALRDAVFREKLTTMDQLRSVRGNLDYAQAWALTDFIAREYGNRSLAELLKEFFINGDRDLTYQKVLGLSRRELWENWRADLQERYQAGRDAPPITSQYEPWIAGYGQQMRAVPAGEGRIVFLSSHQSKYFDLYLWERGKIRRLTEETVSAYTVSPDGGEILFISDKEGENLLYRLETVTGRITPFPLALGNPVEVAWSPTGERLAVTVNTKGDTDIYLISLEGEVLACVTGGEADEMSPSWAPDGERLVYVSEQAGFDQLYIWDGKKNRLLTSAGTHHREPVWGEDGRIYFTFGDRGYYRTAVVDPDEGKTEVLSPFQETLLESYPLPGGEILSTVYRDGTYKIYRWSPSGPERKG
ncbi:MAG: hypothetical protein GX085_02540 [Firmicutes bacterium]|nr:hypothetical protein [Bacillota bacterium]